MLIIKIKSLNNDKYIESTIGYALSSSASDHCYNSTAIDQCLCLIFDPPASSIIPSLVHFMLYGAKKSTLSDLSLCLPDSAETYKEQL